MNNQKTYNEMMARLDAIAETIPEKQAERAAAAIRKAEIYNEAFWDTMHTGMPHNALKEGSDGSGGYLVPDTYEDKLVSLIMLTDRYREKLKNLSKSLAAIELGLSVMDDYEKDLLNAFYVYGLKDAADSLSAKYYKERAQVYRDRMEALKKFTRAVFGVVET